ncbi:MAG: phosphodiester glycosidase family protein [Byssovorax sp.]
MSESVPGAPIVLPEETPTSGPKTTPPVPGPRAPRRRRRLGRALLGLCAALLVLVGGAWFAVNHVPWVGPWLADTLRSIFGTEAVTRLEQWAYDLQDRYNRAFHKDDKPASHWEVPPPSSAPAPAPPALDAGAAPAAPRPFRPADVGPLFAKAAAEGDGIWVSVDVQGISAPSPMLYKTLIHPDEKRPWAELFVVAIDLARVELGVVAGTEEPKAEPGAARGYARSGLIPEADRPRAFAAFNGGFKAEHGHYGMMVDGVTLLRPRDIACTVALYTDGSLHIDTWMDMSRDRDTMRWYRQAPPCLVEDGKIHPALSDENTNWGAALGGATVVRRSALGLDAGAKVLYMGVSNATSPRTIAQGMRHAGAVHVAQLDINWSYPHFVLIGAGEGGDRVGMGLFPGFSFNKDDYLRKPSTRDFFYLVPRTDPSAP